MSSGEEDGPQSDSCFFGPRLSSRRQRDKQLITWVGGAIIWTQPAYIVIELGEEFLQSPLLF